MSDPLRLFLSYAHEDSKHRDEFLKSVAPLKNCITVWHDQEIVGGEPWEPIIQQKLDECHIVVFLVSRALLASKFILEKELPHALEREHDGKVRVVPVLLEECAWESSAFAKHQMLPSSDRPIAKRRKADAWTDVTRGLRRVADAVRPSVDGDVSRAAKEAPHAEADLARYLEFLRAEHDFIDLRGMGGRNVQRVPLDGVYMRLRTAIAPADTAGGDFMSVSASEVTQEKLRHEQRTCDLREILAKQSDAALIGDPGSGKTTFLRYVMQLLARVHQGDTRAREELPTFGGDGSAPLLPVFVELGHFARSLTADHLRQADCRSPGHLSRYVDQMLSGHAHGLPADFFATSIQRGGCFLLLDGLDEVPGKEMRSCILAMIDTVVREGRHVGNRHLVTCRTRAYRAGAALATLDAFAIEPLDDNEIQRFCHRWSRALHGIPEDDTTSAASMRAAAYERDLHAAVTANDAVRLLSANPLMLTMLARVHWTDKQLPEQRVELYQKVIEHLLESRKDLSEWTVAVREEALMALALAMSTDGDGLQTVYGHDQAEPHVARSLHADQRAAHGFIDFEELHSGIIVSRDSGVEFWHLTFQEYLTARALASMESDERWTSIKPHIWDSQWQEIVTLLGGCLRCPALGGGQRAIQRYVSWVLAHGTDVASSARAVVLASRIVHDVLPYGGVPTEGTPYRAMLLEAMALFEDPHPPVEERVLVEIGEAVGQEPEGDPRLSNPEANRVWIAGGTFLMGAQRRDARGKGYDPQAADDESPHEVTVPGFWVDRYPVTVGEFAKFLADETRGHRTDTCWSEKGRAWRVRAGRDCPRKWGQQQRHSNRPVTGVSWYEAEAYATWAGGRLPTEAEWEFAARGAGEKPRRYPWGDEPPTERHANFNLHVGHPTPVGIYAAGATPEGVRDMAGNVWEWCADIYAPYGETRKATASAARVVRGGSFGDFARFLRAVCRNFYLPVYDNVYFGFRCVVSVAGGQTGS
jgi:formylglycine-generating enzyme required for sulfatase activity